MQCWSPVKLKGKGSRDEVQSKQCFPIHPGKTVGLKASLERSESGPVVKTKDPVLWAGGTIKMR